MASSGVGGALGVCNQQAPQIASKVSGETGVAIRRTALKLRNPSNAPDAWERKTLESFARDIAAGADPARLEAHTIVSTADGASVRWMRPIVLQPMCTTCHGKTIDSGVNELLHGLYPQDQAVDYAPGDLRGAFTATVALK